MQIQDIIDPNTTKSILLNVHNDDDDDKYKNELQQIKNELTKIMNL